MQFRQITYKRQRQFLMPIRNLDKIFRPRRIAVVGASQRPLSVGQTVFQNLLAGEFAGEIYPVNSRHSQLGEHRCFQSVLELPEPVDLAVICTPAQTIPEVIQQCGTAGIRGIVILSAGFRETGAAGKALEQAFGKTPVMIREGGSIPIVARFQEVLGADCLLLGWGLNDDNAHSPNEKFCLADFHRGIAASALLWSEIGKISK